MSRDEFFAQARESMGVNIFENDPRLADAAVAAGKAWARLHSDDPAKYQAELFRASVRVRPFKGAALTAEALQLAGQLAPDAVHHGRVRAVASVLREQFGIEPGLAKLVDVDTCRYINSAITEARHRSIDVAHYRWRGVLDGRERPEHRAREGVMFAWDAPPPGGHPGQEADCRCSAEGVYPALDDIVGTFVFD